MSETGKKPMGPVSSYEQAKKYLEDHNIPQLFECLIASLMIERPDNPYNYLDKQIDAIKDIGIDKVEWSTFIKEYHPTKNPIRVELIHDEVSLKIQKDKEIADQVENAPYKADVFKLTETQGDEEE